MGCSRSYFGCRITYFIRTMILINVLLLLIGVLLYTVNRIVFRGDAYGSLYWLMNGYFNDFVGSISFISYCNLVSMLFRHKMYFIRLRSIILLLFICGIFWEVVTPLYRRGSVSDPWDIVAYLSGGLFYYIIYESTNRWMMKKGS